MFDTPDSIGVKTPRSVEDEISFSKRRKSFSTVADDLHNIGDEVRNQNALSRQSALMNDLAQIFKTLDDTDGVSDGKISVQAIMAFLEADGLNSHNNPRVTSLLNQWLDGVDRKRGEMTYDQFKWLLSQGADEADRCLVDGELGNNLLARAFFCSLVVPKFGEFCKEIEVMYNNCKQAKGGKNADYIPQLARADPDWFGVAACTIDGQQWDIGDTEIDFSVQSTSKTVTYCMALEEFGISKVHQHVGREPSGRGFNAFVLNDHDRPHNPMINSGAIMTASMVCPQKSAADRFDSVLQTWRNMAGGNRVGFDNPTYLSEKNTADRNFALGYFMREKGAFPDGADLMEVLDFYFQCCSIELNARTMSVIAATLANGGVCPITGHRIFQPDTVRNCLCLMYSCGMYDYSGEWAFSVGLPCKSGVSGAIMVVIPRVMGICVFSPPLDELGNSFKGVEFCKQLVSSFSFHSFDQMVEGVSTNKRDPRRMAQQQRNLGIGSSSNEATKYDLTVAMCFASQNGDVETLKELLSRKLADPNSGDYDMRTPLHIGAAEGHAEVVELLLQAGARAEIYDRWHQTPLEEARRNGHTEVVHLLSSSLRSA